MLSEHSETRYLGASRHAALHNEGRDAILGAPRDALCVRPRNPMCGSRTNAEYMPRARRAFCVRRVSPCGCRSSADTEGVAKDAASRGCQERVALPAPIAALGRCTKVPFLGSRRFAPSRKELSDLRICEEQGLLHASPAVHLQEFRRREQAIETTAQAKRNQQSFAFGEVMRKKRNFLDGASAAAGNGGLDLRNHSEQMNRSPAARTLPLAKKLRDLWKRLVLEKEYPRSRRCR